MAYFQRRNGIYLDVCMHACTWHIFSDQMVLNYMCVMHICTHACVHVRILHACLYACIYVCMYTCIYVCMYVCMCVYMEGDLHKHTNNTQEVQTDNPYYDYVSTFEPISKQDAYTHTHIRTYNAQEVHVDHSYYDLFATLECKIHTHIQTYKI